MSDETQRTHYEGDDCPGGHRPTLTVESIERTERIAAAAVAFVAAECAYLERCYVLGIGDDDDPYVIECLLDDRDRARDALCEAVGGSQAPRAKR